MKLNDISTDFNKFFETVDALERRNSPEDYAYKQSTSAYYTTFFNEGSTPIFDDVPNLPTSNERWSNTPDSKVQKPSAGSRGLEDIRARNKRLN